MLLSASVLLVAFGYLSVMVRLHLVFASIFDVVSPWVVVIIISDVEWVRPDSFSPLKPIGTETDKHIVIFVSFVLDWLRNQRPSENDAYVPRAAPF
jgi:hypothetical protein